MFIELQTTAYTRSIKCNKGTTFQLIGTLDTDEYIVFEIPDGSGDWMSMIIDGETQQITSTNNIVTFNQPVLLRLNKPITDSNAGVQLVS
jgi:hypothetical protein